MKHGKKYTESAKLIENAKLYESGEALDIVCKTAKAKFDETVELHVRLGVDSRHADQQVRGAVVLPNGTGKTISAGYIIANVISEKRKKHIAKKREEFLANQTKEDDAQTQKPNTKENK